MAVRQFTELDPAAHPRATSSEVREKAGDERRDPRRDQVRAASTRWARSPRPGSTLVGENRLQDLEAKHERWGDAFTWDFIGNLQSRKVKPDRAAGPADPLRSRPSPPWSSSASTRAAETAVLVEVNLAGEESKGGVAPDELGRLHRALPGAGRGPDDDAAVRRGPRGLAPLLRAPGRAGRASTGSSASRWAPARTGAVAVEEGATIIRLGIDALRVRTRGACAPHYPVGADFHNPVEE